MDFRILVPNYHLLVPIVNIYFLYIPIYLECFIRLRGKVKRLVMNLVGYENGLDRDWVPKSIYFRPVLDLRK